MAAVAFDTTYIMEQLTAAVWNLRTEIAIFVAAFCAHALLFGRHKLFSKKAKTKKTTSTGSAPNDTCAQNQHAKALAQSVEDLCKVSRSNTKDVAGRLRHMLKGAGPADIEPALLGLLQNAGRTPPVELLGTIRLILKEHSLPLNPEIGEMLLRGYYAGHKMEQFDDVLSALESAAAAKGEDLDLGPGLQALKGRLRRGDFEGALKRLQGLRRMWEDASNSPSAAPKALLQWLASLAIQKDSLPRYFTALKELGLFSEAFNLVLTECVQSKDRSALRKAEAFGRAEKVPFTDATYGFLLKGAADEKAALHLFAEAVQSSNITKDVLVAAGEIATELNSEALANCILEHLPESPLVEVIGKLFQVYKGVGGLDKALDIYLQHFALLDLSSDPTSEFIIADACVSSGRIDVLRKMLSTTNEATKRVALIKQFGSEKRLDDAFVIFRNIPEKAACLYNAIIDACIDGGGRPETVQEVMAEATQAGVADTVTYNTIIKAHLLTGKICAAHEAVELMKTAGLQPNCVTFNELLDACVKSNNIKEVWAIIDEMKGCGVKPNHITCSILLKTIQSHSAGSNVERILDVLDSMAEEMDEVLLSSVVEACIRVGRVDLLVPYLKRQSSSKKIQVRGPHTYGSIIRAYGFVGDVAGAWETWREMRTRHIVPTAVTLGCMVEAVVTNGGPEAGYDFIQECHKDEHCKPLVNAVIYCSVLKGFSHQKKFDRLWTVYEEMLTQKQVVFSIVTFNTLVDACARCGEMNRIPGMLQNMVSQGIEPNLITYSAILKGYCQEHRLDEAFELMEGMVQTTKYKPDEIMYNTLLDGCARQGLYDRGMKLLGEMEKSGVRPSNFTLSVLVKMASRAKLLDKAFEVCERISTKYRFKLNVPVYSNLIQACIADKDLKRAFEVLERLIKERLRPDVRTYSLLLRGTVQFGQATEAAGLLRAAAGLRGVHPRLMGVDAKLLQPQGGLPPALISEVLEGISGTPCRDERLAVALLKDLRSKPNVKLDPKMQFRLTTQAMKK
jgi:pentatricopeptide repeat protein